MAKTRIVTAPLALVSALFLLLAGPLTAAPACSGVKITTRASNTAKGQPIRNAAELSAALKNAQGGDVFTLASGNYGALTIATAFRKPVTLRSADPKTPACFTGLQLKGAENITFDGVVFDYAYSQGDRNFIIRFNIRRSSNIVISNSVFDGDYKAGVGHGRGLFIKNSSSVKLSNNVFRKWWKGVVGADSTGLSFQGNMIYDIRSDGMGFSGIDVLNVENNHFHNFRGIPNRDHRDMLQIMRVTNRRSTNVTIRSNIFDMGAGDYTQTIFMGTSGKNMGDPMLRHQNILIENNIIYNAQAHGISVIGADNLTIRKNSILRIRRGESGEVSIPRIRISPGSTYVVIEQNAVDRIVGYKNQKSWVVLNNAPIQDISPGAPGYYDREFIYYTTGASHGHHEYGVRPGSMVDRLKAGSTLVQKYPTRK